MNAAELRRHVDRELADARQTIAEHGTEAYTGVCRRCGRPGPCDEQRAARNRLTRYAAPVDRLRTAW